MINVYGKMLTPWGCLPLPLGYIHVYFHKNETSSHLNSLGQSKPNFIWSIWEGGNKVYDSKWSWSHDQDGRNGYK